MEIVKEILKKANVIPLLTLFKKDERGVPMPNGEHKVKILEGKLGKKIDYQTKEEKTVLWLYVEEGGLKKRYPIDLKSKDGTDVNYLIKALADIPEGSEVIMAGKRDKTRCFVEINKVEELGKISKEDIEEEDIPVVEDSEDLNFEE